MAACAISLLYKPDDGAEGDGIAPCMPHTLARCCRSCRLARTAAGLVQSLEMNHRSAGIRRLVLSAPPRPAEA
jgi:hypothetical protein